MEQKSLFQNSEYEKINRLYDECLDYLKTFGDHKRFSHIFQDINDIKEDPVYETIDTARENKFEGKYSGDESPEYDKDEIELNDILAKNDNVTIEAINERFEKNECVKEDKNFYAEEIGFKEIEINPDEIGFKIENETKKEIHSETKSERLRRLSQQLPKIVITQSNTSLNFHKKDDKKALLKDKFLTKSEGSLLKGVKTDNIGELKRRKINSFTRNGLSRDRLIRSRHAYGDFPKRLVSKSGLENISLISNVPFEKIRLLNDTFHTLINLRWRWIVLGTVVTHFTIWLVFAVFWYIAAMAHYDFSANPPPKLCVTGGKDFVTIFLASVEAQTTIGFGDRAIDEECPESIFLFIMQLILGTGLSGVLTCVVYAKLTRPEKLSRDGVGFSRRAVISMRDGQLCLMIRAWDLNYDHIISSEFSAHFVNTYRTKEGELIRYYARNLPLQQRQFLLWPVTLVHVIDETSPLFTYSPDLIAHNNYEITVSLKGASASMGTFTQSQSSYTPKEVLWGHRYLPVVKYDSRKQKYVIEHKKLDFTEPVETPLCSASELYSSIKKIPSTPTCPSTPSNFSDQVAAFAVERSSSFRNKK